MTAITEIQWVNYFGFQRFPFDRPESGNEEFSRPDFLASCFVEPKGFERVFGQADSPVTALLFAARGTGKTACRVMMDYYCQHGLARLGISQSGEPSYVLSVPHIRLDNLLAYARQSSPNAGLPEISVEHHGVEIMRQAIPAFVEIIGKNPGLAENVKILSKPEFEDLSLFIIIYSAYLTSSQKDFLRDMGVDMPPLTNPMKGLIQQGPSYERPPAWETTLYQQRLGVSPLNHIEQWARLMRRIGVQATYVLVDGVDELTGSAQDPAYAYSLIRPLLTYLRLMDETRYFALKFFLPSDLEKLLLTDPAFRRDRGFVIQKLEWRKQDLINILRERLNALRKSNYQPRDRTAAGFDALCVVELRGQIEQNIIDLMDGNPRHLMNFCALMVTAHCNRDIQNQSDEYELSVEDFEIARRVFEAKPVYQSDVLAVRESDISIPQLIALGESETLEFKSSLRYDYKLQRSNKDELGLVIAKTVAGFLNRAGGILVIGVGDKGEILGIEKDFVTLAEDRRNIDGFQLAFRDVIRTYLGMEYLANLHLYFETLSGHIICAAVIEKSSVPVYVKIGENNEFYVRMLNSTVKLGLPETVSYIRSRWG